MTQPAQHGFLGWTFGAGLAVLLHWSAASLWLAGPEAKPPRRPPIKIQLAKIEEPPPPPPKPEPEPEPEPEPQQEPPPPEPKLEEPPPPPPPKPKPKPKAKAKPRKRKPEPTPPPPKAVEPPPLIEAEKPIVTQQAVKPKPTPAPAKPTPPPTPRLDSKARGKLLAGYGRGILKSVQALKHYPASALRLRLEGLAKVELQIDRRGRLVAKPKIVHSTGHRILDEEALKTAVRAAPYPPLPKDFDRPTARIVMPFKFSLPKRG